MKYFYFFLFLFITLPVYAFQFQLQWVKTGGPIGGLGYNVRIHPTNKNIMYVTDAWSGVNKSTDGGQTWFASNTGITIRLGPSSDAIPIFSLTIDSQNPNVVWVGTQGLRGIFKSTDGGTFWTRKDNGITEDVGLTIRNFQLHPTDLNTVFAAGELSVGVQGTEFDKVMGVLYKTTDSGNSWTRILKDSSLCRWMCISQTNPQVMNVFTGIFDREALNTRGKGVLRSSDGGATWNPLNNGILGSLFVGGMSMVGPNIVIGTGNYSENSPAVNILGGIFLTTNAGSTWTQVLGPQAANFPGDQDNVFTAAGFAPSNTNTVYVGNAVAFYRSKNGGIAGSWTRLAGPNGAPYGPPGARAGIPIEVTVDKDNPDVVFVNNYGGGVFKSTDGAQTWQILGKGYTGADIHKIAVSPQNRSSILVDGRSGPFKSSNAGDDWTGIYNGQVIATLNEWYSAAMHPTNSSILLLGDEHQGTIVRSTDGGTSWTIVYKQPSVDPSNPNTRHGIRELLYAPSNPQIVYAGFAAANFFNDNFDASFPNSYGVYKATDGGLNQNSWVAKNTGLESTNLNITSMAISPTDPSLVYIGTRGNGIYKTTNGGDQWVNVTNNLPTGDVFSVAISSANLNLVYAGTRSSGVYKSTDGGASWSQGLSATSGNSAFASKLIIALAVHPTNDNIVFASDWRSGVYRTTDAGVNWQLISTGLLTRAASTLAISADGLYLYAGTKGEGVFRLQTDILTAPATPTLVSPANSATDQQLNVTLQWNAALNADSYRVQLATNQNFSPMLFDDSTLTTTTKPVGPLSLNTTYYWRVSAKNLGGTSSFSSTFNFKTIVTTFVETVNNGIPTEFSLSQNFPNPFNPLTRIEYSLPTASHIQLSIFDLLGREVRVLEDSQKQPGTYGVEWGGRNAEGELVPSGVYIYRLKVADRILSHKMALLR